MIQHLGRRLRLTFVRARSSEDPLAQAAVPVAAHEVEVDLTAFAEDCLVYGRIRLNADRLSDMLNDHAEYALDDVLVESLADGHHAAAEEIVLRRDELLAIHAAGPRGNARRRTRMRAHPVVVRIGPYTVHGHLHVLPGVDPLAAVRHRRPIVPLTEAWIEYQLAGQSQRHGLGTILVNRDVADWIQLSTDDEMLLPELSLPKVSNSMAKDLTGELRVWDTVGD